MTESDFKEVIALKDDGKMKHREGKRLEFKANFSVGSLPEYAKTFAAFSNTSGGIIVFGVKDKPREPIGMTNRKFADTDPEKITSFLNDYFSPEIEWEAEEFEVDKKMYAVIEIRESINKPVICKKNTPKDIGREGDIFYRYNGRSERIKFPELKKILDENKELERKRWMEHLENISRIGPQNIMLVDVMRGEMPNPTNTKIIVDKDLLKTMKIVQEGRFVEKEGAPALKLIGSIEGVETAVPVFNLDDDFYTTKELAKELGLLTSRGGVHYMTAVIWKFDIQKKPEYYQHKGSQQKLYSRLALEYLKEQEITIEKAKEYYREYLKDRRK